MSTKKTRGTTNTATASKNVATDSAIEVLTVTTGVDQANNVNNEINNNLETVKEETNQLDPFAAAEQTQQQTQAAVNQASTQAQNTANQATTQAKTTANQAEANANQIANAVNTYNNEGNAVEQSNPTVFVGFMKKKNKNEPIVNCRCCLIF
jgi:dsDNA-specific endonuclease/ATPase MutS2